MENNVKLSPPWATFYKEIKALFGEDPDINIVYDEDKQEIKMYVEGIQKAEALSAILPTEKVFGNITLKLTVVPANLSATPADLFLRAFEGNPALAGTIKTDPPFEFNYIIFKKQVVQFYNDNMTSPNGITSTLYQDIAADVFEGTPGNVMFCTESIDPILDKPLGEWP